MINEIIEVTEVFLDRLRLECKKSTENPTTLFNLMDDQRNVYGDLQKKCRELIIVQKKQEHFQTLMDNKSLGIRK